MILSEQTKQLILIEKLRQLATELSKLVEKRPDIIHETNDALIPMLLLQDAIAKKLPNN